MNNRKLLVSLTVMAGLAGVAEAQIFSENFDAYTGTWLAASSNGVWVQDGCTDGKISSTGAWSPDHAVIDSKDGSNLRVALRNRHFLTSEELTRASVVQSTPPNSVNGTDDHPLVLGFYLYLGSWTATAADPYYRMNQMMEITCGDDRAPTPMLVKNCGGKDFHHLNLAGDGLMHKAIAVGQVAMADTDPCDDTTNLYQRNFRLSIYDGLAWHFYPSDALHTCAAHNFVQVTIKTSKIEITLWSKFDPAQDKCVKGSTFWQNTLILDRRYPGPFTSLAMGGLKNEETGGCWGQPNDAGFPDQTSGFDSIELSGGVAANVAGACEDTGACCKGDYTCEQLTPTACDAIQGATFQGLGSVCGVAEGRCCADPAMDADHDTDVDMVDFARFQRCLTTGGGDIESGCECFDSNGDGALNETDYFKFTDCASGSGVPALPTCDNPPTTP